LLLNAQQEVLFRQTFAFAFAFAHFLVRHYEAWHLRAVSGLGLRTFDSGLQTSDYGLLSRECVTKPIKRLSIGPDGDAGQAKSETRRGEPGRDITSTSTMWHCSVRPEGEVVKDMAGYIDICGEGGEERGWVSRRRERTRF